MEKADRVRGLCKLIPAAPEAAPTVLQGPEGVGAPNNTCERGRLLLAGAGSGPYESSYPVSTTGTRKSACNHSPSPPAAGRPSGPYEGADTHFVVALPSKASDAGDALDDADVTLGWTGAGTEHGVAPEAPKHVPVPMLCIPPVTSGEDHLRLFDPSQRSDVTLPA